MRPALIGVALGVLGLLAAAGATTLRSGGSPAPQAPADAELEALRAELGRVKHELELEQLARMQLGEALERVEARLDALTAFAEPEPLEALPASEPATEATEAPRIAAAGATPRFDEGALLDAGFAADEVARFRSRADEIELERLYLRDRATREGWLRSPRYARESREINEKLLAMNDEFGDELYDWVLYTTGHSNRLRVSELMENSSAAEAGLEPGDVIVAYDDQRIFSPRALRESTTSGIVGETTALDVLRGGEELRVYVPRGPLGIRIEPDTLAPPPVR